MYLNIVYIAFTTAVASGSSSSSFAWAKLALFRIVENASIDVAKACKTLVTSDARGPSGESAGCDCLNNLNALAVVVSCFISMLLFTQRWTKYPCKAVCALSIALDEFECSINALASDKALATTLSGDACSFGGVIYSVVLQSSLSIILNGTLCFSRILLTIV